MHSQYRSIPVAALILLVTAACSDPAVTGPDVAPSLLNSHAPAPKGLFHRFASIGTSVSMGWQSDGVLGATQRQSWTAQLARLGGREQSAPYIDGPGCPSPLMAPLGSGRRVSGEGAATPGSMLSCAGLESGVTVPAQNVAIATAKTLDALETTPESQPDALYKKVYAHVLPPHTTQLQAALDQRPKFISVELGANDVLGARSGVALPVVGGSMTPFPTWAADYTRLADAVAGEVKHGILVGLVNDAADFPSFRRGSEIWADRPTLLFGFHVDVQPDCDQSPNLIFVPFKVSRAIAAGASARASGLPPVEFSCAGGPIDVTDFVLTPSELAIVNAQLAQMNQFIQATAARVGYAYFALESLYGRPDLKPPFSSAQLITSSSPYGSMMSLDGIHPNAAGHSVIASAAAQAINARYGMRLSTGNSMIALR